MLPSVESVDNMVANRVLSGSWGGGGGETWAGVECKWGLL